MTIVFTLVDAFADAPFTGNPAGVCVLHAPVTPAWMQSVAAEINQAETAFVRHSGEAFDLVWFTPTCEVDLCGHATMAAAHVLWQRRLLALDAPAVFRTKSGELVCRCGLDKIEMDFPSEAPTEVEKLDGLAALLRCEPVWVGRNRMDWFVELPFEHDVRRLAPSMPGVTALGNRGLIVTARASESDADFVSRFFAPQSGVPEDSVTGSAHCALGPYWAKRLGRTDLLGYQASPRGGYVEVDVLGERVMLRGRARTVVTGTLTA